MVIATSLLDSHAIGPIAILAALTLRARSLRTFAALATTTTLVIALARSEPSVAMGVAGAALVCAVVARIRQANRPVTTTFDDLPVAGVIPPSKHKQCARRRWRSVLPWRRDSGRHGR
jgi:hypothetical protein